MERVPEPELMDGLEQAEVYAAADFAASDQALVERFHTLFPEAPGEQLLDLGCGPGNISFRLAERFCAAQVVGMDGAAAMLSLAARGLSQRPWLQPRVRFEQHRLPDPDLTGGFDAVVSNSLLHHLHQPAVLWQAVAQLGCSGACVYVKDLRRPDSPGAALALQRRYLADAPSLLQHDYLASLHAAFTPEEVRHQLEEAGLADQLQVAVLEDRYLEVWGRLL
jgi:2-polyprenyl-3-methyl-5-hydroxy-6-metoxy-1,4-benzoquinol methylase